MKRNKPRKEHASKGKSGCKGPMARKGLGFRNRKKVLKYAE